MSTNLNDFYPVGYGLMSFTVLPYRKLIQEQFNLVLKSVLDHVKASVEHPLFLNSGEFYGVPERHENIAKLGQFFKEFPDYGDKVFVSVKGGVNDHWMPDTSNENITKAIEATNKYLAPLYESRKVRPKSLDMFTVARIGEEPIEQIVEHLRTFQEKSLINEICLSEISAETLTKALKIAKISAIEIEFSLFHREAITNGLFAICKQQGIPVVCYSPLGKGLLVGLDPKTLNKNDFRRNFDKFADDDVIKNNQKLVDAVSKIADEHDLSRSQVAISWITTISNTGDIPKLLPIPGSATSSRQIENVSVVDLPQSVIAEIDNVLAQFKVSGHRYNAIADEFCSK